MSRTRTPPRKARCSLCRAELEGEALTWRVVVEGSATPAGRFCSPRCRDAVRAASELERVATGRLTQEQRRRREAIAEALLAGWRRGHGPEPALVLEAVAIAAGQALLRGRRAVPLAT